MYANVQEYKLCQQFDHIDISGKVGVAEKVMVSVMKDPIAEVQRMLADPAGKAVLRPTLVMDADGQRVYNEMWTADKWMKDQVRWQSTVLPCKAHLRSHSFHSCILRLHGQASSLSFTHCSGLTR